MSTCSHCGRKGGDAQKPCTHCPTEQTIIDVESTPHTNNTAKDTEVIEAEIIPSGHEYGHDQYSQQHQYRQQGSSFRTYTFGQYGRGQNFGLQNKSGCIPGIITLIMAMSLGVQYGFLATIGFLVFYAIASAIALGVTLRRAAMGLYTNHWINRILVWGVSILITVALAS